MEDEAQPNPIGPTPWRFFGDFLGVQKVTRPAGRNPVRRRAESSRLQGVRSLPLICPSVRTGAPSPQGEGYSSGAAKSPCEKQENALIP